MVDGIIYYIEDSMKFCVLHAFPLELYGDPTPEFGGGLTTTLRERYNQIATRGLGSSTDQHNNKL